MADQFDPTQFGAVAVDEPPPFDPTQHGAIPVQPTEEPSILQKTGRAVVDTLKGFLPQSVSDVALAPINMIPGFGQAVKPLENIAFGRPISEGVSPLAGIPVVQRIPQIIQAEKTPALSQERFTTGAGVVADLAMLAGFKSALHPELAEVAGIPKPPSATEVPLAQEAGIAKPDISQPSEPVATDTAAATPIVPEVAPSVPAAESVATAPLPPETTSLGKVEPVAPDLPTGTGEAQPTIHLADWREGGFKELPAVYIRFGELPEGASGKFLEGKRVGDEAGVSVVKAWQDPKTGKYVVPRIGTEDTEDIAGINRKAYLVEGKSTQHLGSDEEPLLQSGSGKVIKEISHDDIVSAEDPNLTYSGKELEEHQTPDWTQPSPVSEAPVSTTATPLTQTERSISGNKTPVAQTGAVGTGGVSTEFRPQADVSNLPSPVEARPLRVETSQSVAQPLKFESDNRGIISTVLEAGDQKQNRLRFTFEPVPSEEGAYKIDFANIGKTRDPETAFRIFREHLPNAVNQFSSQFNPKTIYALAANDARFRLYGRLLKQAGVNAEPIQVLSKKGYKITLNETTQAQPNIVSGVRGGGTAETTPSVSVEGQAPTAPLSTESRTGGESNATQKGQQQESSIAEHPGVPQGSDLPAYGEEVRQGQGERAGGSGSNEPAQEKPITPDRQQLVQRGMNGAVRVVFPDAWHKDLFAFAGRVKRAATGDKRYDIKALGDQLSEKLGIPKGQVGAVSGDYRRQISASIKPLKEGETHLAPNFKGEAQPVQGSSVPTTVEPSPRTEEAPIAPPTEPPSTPSTSLKNAVTAVERDTRGLSPREEVQRRSWDEAKAIADKQSAADPNIGARLVDELNTKPRALDDVEGAHLLRRKAEVNAEHDAAIKQLNANPEDVNAIARLKSAREELQKTYNAAEVSGTAWGRGGKIRQALMAEDFSPQAMESKARAIGNKGKPLADDQLKRVADQHTKIAKQEASIRLTENDLQRPNGRMAPNEILSEIEKMKQRLTPCL